MLAIITVLSITMPQDAQAQTFSVLHYFTGGPDGAIPRPRLRSDVQEFCTERRLTAEPTVAGTVFKLSQVNSSWVFDPLYEFTGGSDGGSPLGGVVIGPNGALYGTTFGTVGGNFGTVFELTSPPTFCRGITCYWNETILHTFTGPDGPHRKPKI